MPAWIATMTTSTPSRCMALACAMARGTSIRLTDHGSVTGSPLVPKVMEMSPIRTPSTSSSTGRPAPRRSRVRAGVRQPAGVERVDGADQALEARVDRVVRGGRARVVAGGHEAVEHLGGCGEHRVVQVRATRPGHGCLEVADRQVGRCDEGLEAGEHRREVRHRLPLGGRVPLRGLPHPGVHQDVAGQRDGDAAGLGRLGLGVRHLGRGVVTGRGLGARGRRLGGLRVRRHHGTRRRRARAAGWPRRPCAGVA